MTLVLLLGGARSGKSDTAVRLAAAQAAPVTLVATAQAGDDEMAQRIARHQRERPDTWTTIEEPLELEAAIARAAPADALILDCLTLWTANLLAGSEPAAVEARAGAAAAAAARRPGLTIAISNEVGQGIVPGNELARRYRDLLGRVNAIWAAAADHAYLLVAGRALALAPVDRLLEAR
ncbi:MAG: bifunctional adenosylcobinamide kinase/adenosylcobinamide-phosphate guanylyltransferase [Solirubrobacteraceae bacterium]|jgi:adenosyl cobinamide kinase/adenosyl cobinamide phosphate guanylyltransferase